MTDPGNRITKFQVADNLLSIRNLDLLSLPISDRLMDFHVSSKDSCHNQIDISFIEDCPDQELYRKRVVDRKIIADVMPDGDEVLFSCHTGQFVAFKRFSRILLWAPYEEEIYDEYDGYPLLQIILWGRISHTGGCYMHGALVVIEGHYVLLLGDSGVGKTTLSNLVAEAGYTSLTEENPFLTWKQDVPWAHATPWYGILGPKKPVSGPLSAIFFLRHANRNAIRKMSPQAAGRCLLSNARMFSWLPATIPGAVELLNKTIDSVPVYDFGFVPGPGAVNQLLDVL